MRRMGFVFVLAAAVLVLVPSASIFGQTLPPVSLLGQSPQPTDAKPAEPPSATGTVFKAATDLVSLSVTVTDGGHRYITGLDKDDFAVLEDGMPQEITFFAAMNVPLDLAVMIDTSASMTEKMAFVHEAATRFVHTLRPIDRAEVLGFSEQARVLVPFTNDIPAIEKAIDATTAHGSTALYTSLYVAIEDLSRLGKKQGEVRRQAIIVLTDGEDTASLLSFDDLLDAAKRAGVAVYPISITSPSDPKTQDGTHRYITESDFSLKSLAQETGARAFFPMELKDLDGTYQQIAQELSSQYSLGYSPKHYGDGAFHKLMVRVLHHPDARSRTRSGYYSTRPITASLMGSDR